MAWRAFDAISPIGGERADRHAALIASTLANIHRGPKHAGYALDDFDLFKPKRRLTRAEEEAQFRRAFLAAGLLRVAN